VTSVIGRSDAANWLSAEKELGGGDILIFGSRRTWNGLVAQGLVDELHLMISPAALGMGRPSSRLRLTWLYLMLAASTDPNNALLRMRYHGNQRPV
jgi:dihydrofolate reductase